MRASFLSVCLIAAPLLAATGASAQYAASEREACTPDVFRLCSAYIPNAGAIANCLRAEKPRLSPACRTVINGRTPARGRTARAGE